MTKRKSKSGSVLPPIVVATNEARRLYALANSNMTLFPREATFLAREMNRANVVPDNADLRGVVHMGSQVRYCDHKTGDVRDVVLVYPHEAQIALKRLSVLTPAGTALIGLSVGQTIEFQTPAHQTRALTVLGVSS
ncbi:regulator of nucleoside diphosphate kinase [Bradyrhizobium sp. AZCC 1588]|uniref:nucleoside diphosphate kinase regulator n=1 Tax=unclassified Bradyrhizobium TaxID=2631580 RepID=UPI002FF23D03